MTPAPGNEPESFPYRPPLRPPCFINHAYRVDGRGLYMARALTWRRRE